jgi:predicted AlkP superfamily phosphohydrolase/phosphomutase
VFVPDNDTGPDACNHDWDGIYVAAGRGVEAHAAPRAASIYDVMPTVLARFDLEPPPDTLGQDLARRSATCRSSSRDRESSVESPA